MKFFIDTEESYTALNTYEVIADSAEEAERNLLDYLNNVATFDNIVLLHDEISSDGYGVTITDNRKEL